MTQSSSTDASAVAASPGAGGWLTSRFGNLYVFAAIFLAASLLLRAALLSDCWDQAETDAWSLAKTFAVGLVFDAATFSVVVLPGVLFCVFLPQSLWRRKVWLVPAVAMFFVTICVLLFDLMAEWFFWQEFSARFNFVAIDYLIYTQELTDNVWESYPTGTILTCIGVLGGVITWICTRSLARAFTVPNPMRRRLRTGGVMLAMAAASLLAVDSDWSKVTPNEYNNELARNGAYSFVEAFFHNVIDYDQFYISIDNQAALKNLRGLLAQDNARFVSDDPADITRQITAAGLESRPNVVILIIESLSADFMKSMGGKEDLTPRLDELSQHAMVFDNFYATGTRTVRGLEAVTLSLPPTPGQSLVKRPDNGGMFSLGSVFQSRQYDTKFIYGGYGYFDNMNAFYAGNGFTTIDRANMPKEEVNFTNAWGVCDEDLFNRVLAEGDRSVAAGKPFLSIVMSTSNHRPFTFPKGKVTAPQHEREGGVAYADYAIGQFIERARGKNWFDNTIFVIVADHCASSAGKMAVPIDHHRIPLLIYAPKLVKPQRVSKLAGQMDVAPTLLGLMNWSYQSKFFGRDVLRPGPGRAMLGNYQKVGLLQGNEFLLLLPKKGAVSYTYDAQGQHEAGAMSKQLLQNTVSYYQSAAWLIEHKKLSNR
ncbi:MAG: LTA synthase family protein [Planctomycetaceae bacterium]|nr:LTA synthase family protein [Planctomycetaceae bacterium]